MTAEEWYQQGNEARKRGQWHEAINAYIQAIALDPDSPAVEAKRTFIWDIIHYVYGTAYDADYKK